MDPGILLLIICAFNLVTKSFNDPPIRAKPFCEQSSDNATMEPQPGKDTTGVWQLVSF